MGAEINPAAAELAKTAMFCNVKKAERKKYLDASWNAIKKNLKEPNSFDSNMRSMLKDAVKRPLVYNILISVLMRASLLGEKDLAKNLATAFEFHKKLISSLPYRSKKISVSHRDARELGIKSGSVDLVITSPPYIGVFNYSRNYKKAMWLAGWKESEMSDHEIGSDKKNLGNKFLTVTQYALDMSLALGEIRRALKKNGRAIIVIGRESKIRGISFETSALLYALAAGQCGLRLILRQERQLNNRFGEKVHEDLLHFAPAGDSFASDREFSREIGVYFLKNGLEKADGQISEDLSQAISLSSNVEPSTMLKN